MRLVLKACCRDSFQRLGGLCLVLLCLAMTAAPAVRLVSSRQVAHARVLTQETTGFAPPPYALATGEPAGDWRDQALPRAPVFTPSSLAAADQTQLTWYRITVPDLTHAPGPHDLYIPRWKSDGTIDIYADGRRLYQSHVRSQWNNSDRPLWIPLDDTSAAAMPREIVIRMQHRRGFGGALSSVWFGNRHTIGWRFALRDWLQTQIPVSTNAAFMGLGLFSLSVWLLRRGQILYLLCFLISAEGYLQSFANLAGSQPAPVIDGWFGWLTINARCWQFATSQVFLDRLGPRANVRLSRIVIGITAACTLLTLPLPGLATVMNPLTPLLFLIISLTGITAFGIRLWSLRTPGGHDGSLLAACGLVDVVFNIHDFLMRANIIGMEGVFLVPYADAGICFTLSYILFNRYIAANRAVERSKDLLEQRLQAREAELAESHRQLRAIELRAALSQERQRLTMDMHDGLGSALVSALRFVEQGKPSPVQIADLLRTCLDDLKLAIDSMEVVDADLLLLLATLRFRLAPRLVTAGITLRWEIQEVPALDWLTPGNSLHILRILQEAFANIIKHSQATEVGLATFVEDAGVMVTIRDNGQGFDLALALEGRGRGLSNQLRRAETLGGTICWQTSGSGTQFSLLLPFVQKVGDLPQNTP